MNRQVCDLKQAWNLNVTNTVGFSVLFGRNNVFRCRRSHSRVIPAWAHSMGVEPSTCSRSRGAPGASSGNGSSDPDSGVFHMLVTSPGT